MDGWHESIHTVGQATTDDEVRKRGTLIDLVATRTVGKSLVCVLGAEGEEAFGVMAFRTMMTCTFSGDWVHKLMRRLVLRHVQHPLTRPDRKTNVHDVLMRFSPGIFSRLFLAFDHVLLS